MTILELLNAANEGYPDGYLAEYYDPKTGKKVKSNGDTLAEFIVQEIIETYDAKATKQVQLESAAGCLRTAQNDLESVITALKNPRRLYQKKYRERVVKTRKPGHEECMTPSCCYHGRKNYNYASMKLSREIKKEREAQL